MIALAALLLTVATATPAGGPPQVGEHFVKTSTGEVGEVVMGFAMQDELVLELGPGRRISARFDQVHRASAAAPAPTRASPIPGEGRSSGQPVARAAPQEGEFKEYVPPAAAPSASEPAPRAADQDTRFLPPPPPPREGSAAPVSADAPNRSASLTPDSPLVPRRPVPVVAGIGFGLFAAAYAPFIAVSVAGAAALSFQLGIAMFCLTTNGQIRTENERNIQGAANLLALGIPVAGPAIALTNPAIYGSEFHSVMLVALLVQAGGIVLMGVGELIAALTTSGPPAPVSSYRLFVVPSVGRGSAGASALLVF